MNKLRCWNLRIKSYENYSVVYGFVGGVLFVSGCGDCDCPEPFYQVNDIVQWYEGSELVCGEVVEVYRSMGNSWIYS